MNQNIGKVQGLKLAEAGFSGFFEVILDERPGLLGVLPGNEGQFLAHQFVIDFFYPGFFFGVAHG